jgi:hypothetical protein
MVMEPRAHFALMREPLESVADRYFVWIDCIGLDLLNRESGLIHRRNPLFRMDWRGESEQIKSFAPCAVALRDGS